MSTPHFSLIIPTYNESKNIALLLERAEEQLRQIDYEILVVDDNSPDKTSKEVQGYADKHPRVRLVVRSHERGLSSAVLCGMDASRGQILGVMDADLSHDEHLLPALVHAVEEGADLAVGSRRIPGGGADHWPWYRRFMSDLATRLTQIWLHTSLSDPMSGYFVLPRFLYDRCQGTLTAKGYKILLEIYCRARPARVVELPFIFKDRQQGYSKVTPAVMLQFLSSLWRLRRSRQTKTDSGVV